jgi:hypothetical protein
VVEMQTVEFPLESGGSVLVLVADQGPAGVVTRGIGTNAVERAGHTFEAALGTVRTIAQSVLGQLTGMDRHPDEVIVEFGVELTANAGAILVTAGTGAHLRVALTWRSPSGSGSEPQRAPQTQGSLGSR